MKPTPDELRPARLRGAEAGGGRMPRRVRGAVPVLPARALPTVPFAWRLLDAAREAA